MRGGLQRLAAAYPTHPSLACELHTVVLGPRQPFAPPTLPPLGATLMRRPAAIAAIALLLTASPLVAQRPGGTTVSGGIGVVTVFRTEVAWEGTGSWAGGVALGVHPMGVPTPEVLVRYRPGNHRRGPYGQLIELSAVRFIPGTQFGDETKPGFGFRLLTGGDRAWGERRFLRLKAGVEVDVERSNDDSSPDETGVWPALMLEVGWRLGGARNP
jgi:hypothetical protein